MADTLRAKPRLIRVWDPGVRLFHWLLVVAIALAFLSSEEESALSGWHIPIGWFAALQAIFDAADELESTLKGLDRAKRTTVRIGALATLSRNFQIAFLKPILGRENVRIVLRSGSMRELMQMLDSHHIDVLLSNMLPPRDETTSWTSHLIADQPISLIGPPSAKRTKTPEAILANIPLIVPTLENHIRGEFDAYAERMSVTPRIVAEVDDMALLRLLAREGLGYAIVPPIVVRDELASNALKECGPLPGLKERFYAITPSRRFPNPLIKALMQASGQKRTPLGRKGHGQS